MKVLRDVLLEEIFIQMDKNKKIFFLSADFGSPVLDKIRDKFPNRFINVGIAEQNLINIATGLALEGFDVYVYAIAPFLTMRAYEQIRVNLAIMSEFRDLNVNLIGVGAGISYSMSGPTHHCLEDLSIMNTLPNIEIFSPSDENIVKDYISYSLEKKSPKYIRLDAKPLDIIDVKFNINDGFRILNKGQKIAIIATGYMVHKLLNFIDKDIMIIDIFSLNNFNKQKLKKELNYIDIILTFEEGFVGGFSEINKLFLNKVVNYGFEKHYQFVVDEREKIAEKYHLGLEDIKKVIDEYCQTK